MDLVCSATASKCKCKGSTVIRVKVRYVRSSTAATIVRADEGPEMAKEDLHLLYLHASFPLWPGPQVLGTP